MDCVQKDIPLPRRRYHTSNWFPFPNHFSFPHPHFLFPLKTDVLIIPILRTCCRLKSGYEKKETISLHFENWVNIKKYFWFQKGYLKNSVEWNKYWSGILDGHWNLSYLEDWIGGYPVDRGLDKDWKRLAVGPYYTLGSAKMVYTHRLLLGQAKFQFGKVCTDAGLQV